MSRTTFWLHAAHPQSGKMAAGFVYFKQGDKPVDYGRHWDEYTGKSVHEILAKCITKIGSAGWRTGHGYDIVVCVKSLVSRDRQESLKVCDCTITYKPLSEFPQDFIDFRNNVAVPATDRFSKEGKYAIEAVQTSKLKDNQYERSCGKA